MQFNRRQLLRLLGASGAVGFIGGSGAPRGAADYVEIRWPAPSNRVERFTDIPVDRYTTVQEGSGSAVTS